ncbi:MAG TPA: hypothetical protein VJS37_08535 [Terriglobales bacterium]|nr:hypothetical protein [Terriglobales bacterium]
MRPRLSSGASITRKAAPFDVNSGKFPFHDRDPYVVSIGRVRKIVSNGSFPGAYNR